MARPKKDNPPAKTRRITIRLTENQYELIALRAAELNLSAAEYVRHQAIHGEIKARYHVVAEFPQIQNLAFQFSAIGNNLNQIARYFHMGGMRSRSIQEEIHKCIEEIMKLRQKVLELAGDDDGHPETYDE